MKKTLLMLLVSGGAFASARTAEDDAIKNAKYAFDTAQKELESGRASVSKGDRYYGGRDHLSAVKQFDDALKAAKAVKSPKGKSQVKDVLAQAPKLREEALAESFDYLGARVQGFLDEKKAYEAAQSLQDLQGVAKNDPRFKKLMAKSGCGPDKQSPWMIDCKR